MPTRVTDPELLKLLEAPEAAAGRKRVSDPELLRQLNDDAAQPGGMSANDLSTVTTGGIIEGVPVIGPYLREGADRAAAYARSLTGSKPYEEELAGIKARGQKLKTEHPHIDTGAQATGGVLGTLPMVAAAPGAFGAGTAGLGARTAASLFSGAGIGGADAAVRSRGDINEASKGALLGGALGAVAPAAGMAVGAGARGIGDILAAASTRAPGVTGSASSKLLADLRNAGGGGAVRARLGELGPEAMLLDAAPTFTGRAQGLAILPDTREAVVAPLAERARGANARIGEDVQRHLGPSTDPAAYQAAHTAAYGETVPPLYRDALAQPVTVNTADVLETIGRIGATEKGGAHRALERAWNLLHTEAEVPGVGRAMVPDRRPEALHNAKEALDAMIATVEAQQGSAARSELRALSTVRSGLNGALEAQVPGYAEANRTAQHFFQQRDAFGQGQTLLSGGREAARPAQLAADTAAMTPEVQQAQRLGLRAEIDRLLGTQLNDRLALRKAILGEGDFNRARMGTVFGEEPTAGLAATVDREAAFDTAFNDIVRNSQTAQRAASAMDVAPREVSTGSGHLGTVIAGATGGAEGVALANGLKALRLGTSAAGRASDIARNRELARAVTLRRDDPALDALLNALGARALRSALAERAGRAAEVGANAAVRSQGERARPYLPALPRAFRWPQ